MKNLIGSSIPANYFRGAESVGGKLLFDETGMTFSSHSFNVRTGETRIDYADVSLVRGRNTLGIVPNGVSVFTQDGFEHRFVVNGRDDVMAFITAQARLARQK